jgi:hypothetical protein
VSFTLVQAHITRIMLVQYIEQNLSTLVEYAPADHSEHLHRFITTKGY